ncbi:hypothetical protein PBY51_010054 [Eleginops maclovinus]|uniref:Uncharacterized protein n=1 Tax=Eleginops maclovinus TaxID=56733 RepID=A0AAN7XZS5_ELEMC|nr:hypothetical protein PBY51_010054 [Eleginops maclovinus]
MINACDKIYKAENPKTFSHCDLKKFSAFNPTHGTKTQATLAVVFHETTPYADLPQNDDIIQTFVKAVNNSNNSFNVSIYPASVNLLASLVTDPTTTAEQLSPPLQRKFPDSFKSLEVVSFRNGSVYNTMYVTFASTSVPKSTQISSLLFEAASSVTGFDIEGSSININGISSSGKPGCQLVKWDSTLYTENLPILSTDPANLPAHTHIPFYLPQLVPA